MENELLSWYIQHETLQKQNLIFSLKLNKTYLGNHTDSSPEAVQVNLRDVVATHFHTPLLAVVESNKHKNL